MTCGAPGARGPGSPARHLPRRGIFHPSKGAASVHTPAWRRRSSPLRWSARHVGRAVRRGQLSPPLRAASPPPSVTITSCVCDPLTDDRAGHLRGTVVARGSDPAHVCARDGDLAACRSPLRRPGTPRSSRASSAPHWGSLRLLLGEQPGPAGWRRARFAFGNLSNRWRGSAEHQRRRGDLSACPAR